MHIVNDGIVLILNFSHQINARAKLKVLCFEIHH